MRKLIDKNNDNDYSKLGEAYSKHLGTGKTTKYLAFKELNLILLENINLFKKDSLKVLDYGCGAGDSTVFLRNFFKANHFKPIIYGVDNNNDILQFAKEKDDSNIIYMRISDNHVPVKEEFYDLILCSFVLLDRSSLKEIEGILKECGRILKPKGSLIIITADTQLYNINNEWVSMDICKREKEFLDSGDPVRIKLKNDKNDSFEMQDYFWQSSDYENIFSKLNLKIIERRHPLGVEDDGIEWKSEKYVSPYLLYVLGK